MHKETVIAVAIGLVLGLILTFGVYQWKKSTQPQTEIDLAQETPSPTPQKSANQEIIIETPKDGEILNQPKTLIKGSGPAQAFLVIFVNDKEIVTQINNEKQFSVELELAKGPNVINLTALENSGNTYTTDILLVYEPIQ